MGTEIRTEHFTDDDHTRFKQRLDEQIRALDRVLSRPGFGVSERSLGVELELSLVDRDGRATAIATELVDAANTPAITPEMGAFDIELSTPPVGIVGAPFSDLRASMAASVDTIRLLAHRRGARAVPISILPTLRIDDFNAAAITDQPRYRALARGMQAARGGAFEIAIEGDESLHFSSHDAVSMEAANTAFQVHLSCAPAEFAPLFNAAMMLSAPVIAAAANSPTFLGKKLWHETRVALFKQAGDDRPPAADADIGLPPRVNFGNSWVRDGALEVFMESVALYPPLLPECAGEAELPLAVADAGGMPNLCELRLHHGTVWNWNRPVYDPSRGGGLRIELRALPAGPSYDDMLANAAFLVGAMLGLRDHMATLSAALPFALAKQNFFLAARHGLDAQLAWPQKGSAPATRSARDILVELLPIARQGLRTAGVSSPEVERFIGIFEARVATGQTGAVWQRAALADAQQAGHRGYDALRVLLDRYIAGFNSQLPVHAWALDPTRMQAEERHV